MKIVDLIHGLKEYQLGERVHEKKETKLSTSKSQKSRMKTYNTLADAISSGQYGEIFTTNRADRTYVLSKGKWGAKSGRGKIAKGFTPGSSTPSSEWGSIKKPSARTLLRHGKGSRELAKKYGSRSLRKEKGIGGADGIPDKGN